MRLKTKLRLFGLVLFGIGCIGVGVREYNSYLVTKTVITTQIDRIYPVWGNGTLAFWLFMPCFMVGFFWVAFIIGDILFGKGYFTDGKPE